MSETTFSPGLLGWLLIALRGALFLILSLAGLILLVIARGLEWALLKGRPLVTPAIAQGMSRTTLWLFGFRLSVSGRPDPAASALVANHISWVDILAINAADRVSFVAKGDVAGWPVISWLARAVGTVFVGRVRAHVTRHVARVAEGIGAGRKIAFFPEPAVGTGAEVLPFRSSLFDAIIKAGGTRVQPVTVRYLGGADGDGAFYSWGLKQPFRPHVLKVLAKWRQGPVSLTFHPSLPVSAETDRKQLARACELVVRDGLSG